MRRSFTAVAFSMVQIMFWSCSNLNSVDGGGSSETVNAKVIINDTTVTVSTQDQQTHSLSLHVYSSDYEPYSKSGYSDSATANGSEISSFRLPSAGSFSLLVSAKPSESAVLMTNMVFTHGAIDTIDCTLKARLNIKGFVQVKSSASDKTPYLVEIDGSPFYCLTDSTQRFSINGLPSGSFVLKLQKAEKTNGLSQLFKKSLVYNLVTENIGENTTVQLAIP